MKLLSTVNLKINFYRGLRKFLSFVYRALPHECEKILDNWDYLIILDACRYDLFKEVNDIEGRLEKRISCGSYTPEWLEKNFSGMHEDIVYVSANAFVMRDFKENFHHVEDIGEYGWDEEVKAVPPREITKAALREKEEFPEKRMIIHYSQPHAPFIGKERIERAEDFDENLPSDRAFDMARAGLVSDEKLRKAYKSNLKLVLDEVKNLLKYLEGKIIITSDHGELLGEKIFYGHRRGLYFKELVDVPWLEMEKSQSDETDLNIKKKGEVKEKEVKERLKSLGYIE